MESRGLMLDPNLDVIFQDSRVRIIRKNSPQIFKS